MKRSFIFLILLSSQIFATDLINIEDVVFKPQYRGGSRYGTAFFISPDGYFLATNHGFEKCKNHTEESGVFLNELQCPTYEAIYKEQSYNFSLIAYPDFKDSANLTLAKSFRRKDFLLGKVELLPGQTVPYVDLTEADPTFRYQQPKKIAGVTIAPFAPAIKKVTLPGFSGAKLIVVQSRMIGKHYDHGYLMTITNNPELKGGASGSPVFDQEGHFLGLLCAKTDKVAVVLAKQKILEGLLDLDSTLEDILFWNL